MDEQMFCHDILLHRGKDGKDKYRAEYNRLLADHAKDTGNVLEQKHLVVSTNKRNIKETRDRLRQVQGTLVSALSSLGCTVRTVSNNDRLQVLHNFFGAGKEQHFRFDLSECRRLGHDFRDYVSPDTMAFKSDHIEIDHRFAKAMGMVQYPQKLDDSQLVHHIMTQLSTNTSNKNFQLSTSPKIRFSDYDTFYRSNYHIPL